MSYLEVKGTDGYQLPRGAFKVVSAPFNLFSASSVIDESENKHRGTCNLNSTNVLYAIPLNGSGDLIFPLSSRSDIDNFVKYLKKLNDGAEFCVALGPSVVD